MSCALLFRHTEPCADDHFRCSTFECVPSVERCDGKQQCLEGSDEYGCLHLFNVADDGSLDVRNRPGFLGVAADPDSLYGVCALHWDMRSADMACQYVGDMPHFLKNLAIMYHVSDA